MATTAFFRASLHCHEGIPPELPAHRLLDLDEFESALKDIARGLLVVQRHHYGNPTAYSHQVAELWDEVADRLVRFRATAPLFV